MTYARAGHERPLLLRGGDIRELGGQGTALGLFESSFLRLTEEQVELAPGDRLVLYTDGLTDVLSPEGKSFERQALKDLLCACAALPLNLLCSAVFARLTAYQGSAEQFDDMTMLVLEVEA
jgi:sigma-B regulation protein RsbU (phosphoserine phosphatase)